MQRLNNYSIDIARNPAAAIQKISDPILNLINAKIDEYVKILIENLGVKKAN